MTQVFSVQAQPADAASWLELAARCEQAGFDTLQAADQAIGRERPGVRGRVDRCLAVAEAVVALLAGEMVTRHDPLLEMIEPRPVQAKIPPRISWRRRSC